MQAAFPAAFYFGVIAGLLWLPVPVFSQYRLTIDEEIQASEQTIELALARRGSVEFSETPLHDAMVELTQQFQIPIVLSLKKLEEASVSADTPITVRLSNLSLESILGLILERLELAFTIRHEVLLITTPEDVESQLTTRTYPVLDLVFSRSSGSTVFVGADYDSLIEIITTTIKPDSWDNVGGPGAIDQSENAGSLVVSHTIIVHRQIERLLSSLRRAKSLQGISSLPVPRVVSTRSAAVEIHRPHIPSADPVGHNWQLPHVHD